MPELILLCEGAAPDRSGGAAGDAFDDAARAIRGTTQARWLRACLGAGQVVHDRVDDAPVMRESPADAWLRARMAVPASDTVQAYAAVGPEASARSARWSLTPANALVGYDHIRLRDPGELALDAAEARELAAAAAPLFAEAGYGLELASPQRWYFTAETGAAGRCAAVDAGIGSQHRALPARRARCTRVAAPGERGADALARAPGQRAARGGGAPGR